MKSLKLNFIEISANRKMKLHRYTLLLNCTTHYIERKPLLILVILLCGDIELNPGPRNESIFPCGHCDLPVNWPQKGLCCNECGVWHHKSCEDIDTKEDEYLEHSSVVWHCCICDSINIDSFTFNSYELNTSNVFFPLSENENTIDSLISTEPFSPLHFSSPIIKRSSSSSLCTSSYIGLAASQGSTISNTSEAAFLPKKTNLRLLTVNCCSIREHKQEFTACVNYTKPDIICGTESWLKGIKPGKEPSRSAIKSCEVFPDNYNFYRNDRMSRGGGVFTGVKKDLISDEQVQLVTECEIEWTKVKMKGKKDLYLSSFYMSHRNMNDLIQLDNSLEKLTNIGKNKHILMGGDFNCPDIDWENLQVKPNAPDKAIQQALIDITIKHGLTQVHNQPTRQESILDLVFTNNPSVIKTSTSIPGISDHAMVVTDSDIKPIYNVQQSRRVYLFSKANWTEINKDCVELSDQITKMKINTVQERWDTLKTNIQSIMDKHIPSKIFKKRNIVPWFNRALKKMTKRKARLYSHAKKTKQWSQYKQYQKLCKREFKKAEVNYINETIQRGFDENNCKPFWRYVKSKQQDFVGTAPLKRKGTLLSEGKDKAEILVEQFRSVFSKQIKLNLPFLKKVNKEPLPTLHITIPGVEKLLSKIKTSKAVGPDNISNVLLKNCAKQLAPCITSIFQHLVDSGNLPDDWVNANVTPVYKKGDVHLAENYRPVSLTSVTCKLLEHIICKHILDHLEYNDILTHLNHGFRSGYSCETQLLVTMEDLLKNHNAGYQTDVIILDFSKAFDTVPHRELLHKLTSFGIEGPIHTWIKNFLTTRYMRVVVDGECSRKVTVDSGVPQGTVMGPLLFLCHINDLPQSVNSQVRLFADDCLLYRKISSQEDHHILQNDLIELEQWAKNWGMHFNAKKCHLLSINNRSSHFYTLCGEILNQVTENPYLGLTLSQDLKWSTHITQLTKKANSTMAVLRRNLRNCTKDCRKIAYISLVRSLMDYGAIIWDPYIQKDVTKLERVQRQAARFITNDYKTKSEGCMTKMLQELDLPPLQDRRKSCRLVFLYKVVEGLVPAIPAKEFVEPARSKRKIKTNSDSNFNTKNLVDKYIVNNNRGLKIQIAKTEQYRNSFFIKTTADWNHLPSEVVGAGTVEGFKSALSKCY